MEKIFISFRLYHILEFSAVKKPTNVLVKQLPPPKVVSTDIKSLVTTAVIQKWLNRWQGCANLQTMKCDAKPFPDETMNRKHPH